MNLPNALTMLRFFLIPVYIAFFQSGRVKTAFFVLLLAGLTDILDGYLARRSGRVTFVGSMLDPLADKTLMLAVMFTLLFSHMIPWAAAAAMILRDAGMIAGSAFFHFRGKKTVPATTMGKLTTVLYYIAIPLILFEWEYAVQYLWAVIIFSFLTSLMYIIKFIMLNDGERKAERG